MAQVLITAGQALASNAASAAASAAAAYAASQATIAAQNALGPLTSGREGPRLDTLRLMGAQEGAPIPRLYGRARLPGHVIWFGGFEEETEVTVTSSGGKGVTRASEQTVTEYRYRASLAVALCEGPIDRIGRVWADGEPLALRDYDVRLHDGSEDQLPDPLIEAALGADAPAYRGLAYLVFERMPLARFGNCLPQLTFEVERSLRSEDEGALENAARAVTLIPASGEAVYDTEPVFEELAEGVTRPLNVFNNMGAADVVASLDHLQDALWNTGAVELIVSWFGTDLRAGACQVRPGVESRERVLLPEDWRVAGEGRDTAYLVTRRNGGPAYGGTPSDRGVLATLADLKSRGLAAVFYPFVLMDIAPGNGSPDPYGGAEQGAYPWRGRITVTPGTDGTASARAQVDAFFGTYASMIRHYAQLCAEAGGVSAFLIGSELRGLTRVRDEAGRFPAVEHLIALAREVKAVLPAALVSYAADWSEYAHYQPGDGSLLYPLDALWADEAVGFVGIDNYLPLADWRGEGDHLDRADGHENPYDLDYLRGNIRGGEGYDWYYADEAARDAQTRTPIEDTAYDEDWVFRPKDLWSWWSNPHTERPGGVKGARTAWVPASKPIWFTELGCSAADGGANQPNVFVDPKSSESFFPYHSNRDRDDLIQRRFLEAHLSYWTDTDNNPVSPLYGGPMVEPSRVFLYTWDARPFPDFPVRGETWSDAKNWTYGHWLNGRAGRVPLSALIEDVARRSGLHAVDASACTSMVTGYVLDRPMSGRAALAPLFALYQLDAVERDGLLIVRPRTGRAGAHLREDALVDEGSPVLAVRREPADALPASLALTYVDGLSDYRTGTAQARMPSAPALDAASLTTAVVLEAGEAEGRTRALLAEAQGSGATARFALPPSELGFEPSDVLTLGLLTVRLLEITDGPWREVEGVLTDSGLYQPRYTGLSGTPGRLSVVPGPLLFEAMDLPLVGGDPDVPVLHLAGFASPWPGSAELREGQGAGAPIAARVASPSVMGRLAAELGPGPGSRWDRTATLWLRLPAGALSSLTEREALSGGPRLAVRSRTGSWEVLSYRDAVLDAAGLWRVTTLLRGLRGSEAEAWAGAEAGARVVILGGDTLLPYDLARLGTEMVWQAGPQGARPGRFPFADATMSFGGASLRPLAPVHLTVRREADRLRAVWTRRTRVGGDGWDAVTPLGEGREAYLVRAYGESGLIEEHEVEAPGADLPEGTTHVHVAQISPAVGPGRWAARAL